MEERLVEDFFLRLKKVEGIERELKLEKIKNKVYCIVGPRKSGKTWFMRMHATDELYVDLQDAAFKGISSKEFFKVIEIYTRTFGKSAHKIFIDEVQQMKDWEFLLLSLLNRGYEIFATGSSSKILKKEFSSLLRGKNVTQILLPFSFREFLRAKEFQEDLRTFEGRGKVQKFLKDFLLIGGYMYVWDNAHRCSEGPYERVELYPSRWDLWEIDENGNEIRLVYQKPHTRLSNYADADSITFTMDANYKLKRF
jgi:predicted AAA+ superfamily ATPase